VLQAVLLLAQIMVITGCRVSLCSSGGQVDEAVVFARRADWVGAARLGMWRWTEASGGIVGLLSPTLSSRGGEGEPPARCSPPLDAHTEESAAYTAPKAAEAAPYPLGIGGWAFDVGCFRDSEGWGEGLLGVVYPTVLAVNAAFLGAAACDPPSMLGSSEAPLLIQIELLGNVALYAPPRTH